MKAILVILLVSLTLGKLFTGFKEQQDLEAQNPGIYAPEMFDQELDHFDPTNKEVWKQRYYAIDTYWDKKDGPYFLYIGGEGPLNEPRDTSFLMQLAKEFKGMVFALEHRFYGVSQPRPDWSVQSLTYLSPDQGLADLAYFATKMNEVWAD